MRVPLIFLLILISFSPNLSIDHKYFSSLYQFITVKTDSDGNNDPSSSISGGNGENQEGGGDMVVFKHRGKPKVIDHRHGTDGYNRTIYFLKKNVVRVVPTLNTLYHLGVREGDLVEVTEEDFRQFTVNFEPVPKPDSHLEGTLDGVIDDEIRKSDILQGIHLRNITYVGEYLNPAIIPFRGRLLLATGLAWGFRDNHNANEHLEFRWLNHTLFPFYSYSQRRKEFKTAEEKDSDPNPTDTYHLGINEQHVANVLDNRIVVGQDPRMVAVNDREVYVVFTNRFNNPIAMGIAYLRLNDTAEQMEVLSLHMAIQQSEERGNQKNWSPFLLPVHHHTHDTTSSPPHAHLRSHEVEYRRDIYFIQQINPLTVYEVKYEDISTPDGPIYGTLFSKADVIGIDHLQWNYGHLRGGTNAIYLPRRHEYLSLFHSSSIISGNTMTTYVFGAYTFTATHPFRLTAYTAYPILHPLLYKGPYDYLKNRHIDYVAFPMSISLINDDETVLLSFGHQDCRGFTAELNLHEILQNMIPIQSHNHERGNKEEKTERRVRRKRRNT